MRIPFPTHIRLRYVVGFALILFGVQLTQGTAIAFAICSFLFIIVSGITFNLAGGFSRPSGAYIFFYSVLAVIVGLVWKAVLGEPADSNLATPILTIEVFLGGITAMFVAVFFSRKVVASRPLLGNLLTETNRQNATVGCLVAGLTVTALLSFFPHDAGGILSAVAQINRFLPMALILGVIHQIQRTGGKRSTSLPVLLSGGSILFLGLLGFSKEGIFLPLVCWLVAAASQGYRFSRLQIGGLVIGVFFMFHYLVPYSQYGRNFMPDTFWGKVRVSSEMLSNLEDVRTKNRISDLDAYEIRRNGYFNTPQGFADRLQMVSVDDALIEATEQHGTFGLTPIVVGFENLVPRFLWPNKPTIGFGNIYSHELDDGALPDDDTTTGISYSPSGEAYHIGRWLGIFILAPALWMLLFIVFDSLCGDTRTSPWGLLMIAYFAHVAPEGMLGGIIYALGYMTFGLVVAALSAAYAMPILGSLIKGPEKIRLRRTAAVGSVARRVPRRMDEGVLEEIASA